jgi:hypothetical protein
VQAEQQRIVASPEELARFCAQLRAKGPPTYYPSYMIQHGMGAFGANNPTPLVDGFDPEPAWARALEQYIRCQ